MTQFSTVYNRFLGKITDDMYMELTPEDTVKDLQKLLIDAIPGFEFPRKNLYDYTINTEILKEDLVTPGDFIIKSYRFLIFPLIRPLYDLVDNLSSFI